MGEPWGGMNCCFEVSILLDSCYLKVMCFNVVLHHSLLDSKVPGVFSVIFSHLLSQDIKLLDVETVQIHVCEGQGQNHLASNLKGFQKANCGHTLLKDSLLCRGFWLNKKKW